MLGDLLLLLVVVALIPFAIILFGAPVVLIVRLLIELARRF